MKNLIITKQKDTITLCDACKRGEPVRPAEIVGDKLSHETAVNKDESDIIKCAICDIHGYLAAIEAISGKRRSSRVMFSWLMPVSESVYKQVIHSRVTSGIKIENKETSQMIFNKSYASGIYAFVSAIDVERIGIVESQIGNEQHSGESEKTKEKTKIAIEAYREMLSGKLGASLSHAIPHNDIKEILVSYSEEGPLPFPISPMYTDYLNKTIGLMPNSAKHLYYGSNTPPSQVTKKNNINELIDELLGKI